MNFRIQGKYHKDSYRHQKLRAMLIVIDCWMTIADTAASITYDCHHNAHSLYQMSVVSLSVLNTWALMPILKQWVCSMDCEVCVEGRGKSVLRNMQEWGLNFRIEWTPVHCSSTSCTMFVTTAVKNLEVSTFKEVERHCFRELPSNWQTSFSFEHVLLPTFAKCTHPGPISHNFFYGGVTFATVKIRLFSWRMPCFMLWWVTLKVNTSEFPTRSTFISTFKGKRGVLFWGSAGCSWLWLIWGYSWK